ncbi:MAG: hypothetical protein QUT30_20970 [Acidobacteriota bacterium]|jgi:hypothetical protein|nr:hypothetical protein [Acidobacteriota bacterium]
MAEAGTVYKEKQSKLDRVKKLKEELKTLSGGDAVFRASPVLSEQVEAEVLEDILAFESVGQGISMFEGLKQKGLDLPHPDKLNEFQSRRKALEVLKELTKIGVFCIGFDGMSGRELYRTLYHQTLWEGCYIKRRHPEAITLVDVSRKLPRSEMERFLDGMMARDTIH